ncbi:glycosyltransferase family 2 protein [Fulvivirga ulvae]|uniref:glycosyltransferase family A protein n=1 Tax=Fulvivirga ulvae TaxID=2904245 RepID=UPI001F44A61E|nr:glycosyltransferase family A protein [Fulvivirga ulvae]UII31847.1 glycosyltransferase family 2 protein [Fulvivirga ulvae]
MSIEYIIENGFAFIGVETDCKEAQNPLQSISQLVNFDYVIILEGPLLPYVDQVLESEWLESDTDFIVFLVDRKVAPAISGQDHGPVRSFICSAQIFDIHYSNFKDEEIDSWAYYLMQLVYETKVNPDQLVVKQLPFSKCSNTNAVANRLVNVVIPHKGKWQDLNSCLNYQLKCEYNNRNIAVAFDEYNEETDRQLMSRWGHGVSFYYAKPDNVGPYVIRELLINQCDGGIITFVDSDDISCTDRLKILAEALNDEVRMVGSHELRFDAIDKRLRAIRYPLNVSKALETHPGFPLLHSTAAMFREDFDMVGGYSTNRKFANDTQFLLRSYFFMKIMNVDEFLYIRKTHTDSLTSGKAHPLNDEVRTQLANQWNADFEHIKSGSMNIQESSLYPEKRNGTGLVAAQKWKNKK